VIYLKREKKMLNWQEKLQLYVAGLILLGFIFISSETNKQRDKKEKIQECVQLLDNEL
tara:strand:- start:287 stop:460 length:174 start_codon:yes stop_codon:yes gene_type:complete